MGIYSYSNEARWHLDEDNYSETVLYFTLQRVWKWHDCKYFRSRKVIDIFWSDTVYIFEDISRHAICFGAEENRFFY